MGRYPHFRKKLRKKVKSIEDHKRELLKERKKGKNKETKKVKCVYKGGGDK